MLYFKGQGQTVPPSGDTNLQSHPHSGDEQHIEEDEEKVFRVEKACNF